MRVHYFQHVPFEGTGCIGQWLSDHQHQISSTKFYENGHQIPDVDAVDALIIMGGPMGVYDDEQYLWLTEEKKFIKACIQANKIILGICLGAQLISVCLGGQVKPARNKEIGWFPVEATTSCKNEVPWFYELLKDKPVLFHWHGDQFSIPLKAHDLALSEANDHQAFTYAKNVIGLQFHLECTPQDIQSMLRYLDESDQSVYIQTAVNIAEHLKHCTHMNKLMDAVMNHLFKHSVLHQS